MEIVNENPKFSAIYNDPDLANIATEYRIQVTEASDTDFSAPIWDSFDDDNYFLLSSNTSDEDTLFDDSGRLDHAITPYGTSIHHETDHKKFGTSSIQFNGTDDYLIVEDHREWNIPENWTLDFWVKHSDLTGDQYYIGQYEDEANYWQVTHEEGIGIRFRVLGGNEDINLIGEEIDDNLWHHIAVVKEATTVKLFKDGSLIANATSDAMTNFAGNLSIGAGNDGLNNFKGYMDELRMSKKAVWTQDSFTPMTESYKSIPDLAQGSRSSDIVYSGPKLANETEYIYRIKFWDQNEMEGEWSTENVSFYKTTPFDSVEILTGAYQEGKANELLSEELQIRITKSSNGTIAGLGEVPLDFQIIQTPTEPRSTTHELQLGTYGVNSTSINSEKISTETDSNGYASAKVKLGERAGVYTVMVKFHNGNEYITEYIHLVEKEELKFELDKETMQVISSPMETSSKIITFNIISNAASYELYLKPNAWLTHQEDSYKKIENWNTETGLGFAWKKTTDQDLRKWAEPIPDKNTQIFACAESEDCSSKTISVELNVSVDYTTPAGLYNGDLIFEKQNIKF